MAVAWNPQTSHADEWKWWPNRESLTHRIQSPVGTYSNQALSVNGDTSIGKRRALTFKEYAASAGAYTASNLAFLVPVAAFATAPKAGDKLRDAAAVDYTILDIQKGKFGLTYKFTTLALALVNGLTSTATLYRPDNTTDAAGKRDPDLAVVASEIACRVQGITGRPADFADGTVIRGSYVAYIDTRIIPRQGDVWAVDGGSRYTITGWDNPDRIDQLMTLQLDDLTEGA